MTYREVRMVEVKEVLRLWLAAVPKKRIATMLGLDRKTVRRYIVLAEAEGLVRDMARAPPRPARHPAPEVLSITS